MDILCLDLLVESEIHGSINICNSSRFWISKAAQDRQTTTTILDSFRIFLFWNDGFMPNATTCKASKYFFF